MGLSVNQGVALACKVTRNELCGFKLRARRFAERTDRSRMNRCNGLPRTSVDYGMRLNLAL